MCKVVHLQTILTIDMLINNFAFFVSYVWKKKKNNGQKENSDAVMILP